MEESQSSQGNGEGIAQRPGKRNQPKRINQSNWQNIGQNENDIESEQSKRHIAQNGPYAPTYSYPHFWIR